MELDRTVGGVEYGGSEWNITLVQEVCRMNQIREDNTKYPNQIIMF